MEISYLNGKFIPKVEAKISIEDRGFNFSDGVYEVIRFSNNVLFNYKKHITRLKNSLKSLDIKNPFKNIDSLKFIIFNLIDLNNIKSGFLYVQITRGTSIRNHVYPENIKPNIIISIFPEKKNIFIKHGVSVITSPDLRWKRCDIKSISLLPNVLGKLKAINTGNYEVWQTNANNQITEGTTSNSFIILKNNVIMTHPKNNHILGGVTRDVVIKIAKKNNFIINEKAFTVREAEKCKEAFLTSTTVGIIPVISINKKLISKEPGCLTKNLIKLFNEDLRKQIT